MNLNTPASILRPFHPLPSRRPLWLAAITLLWLSLSPLKAAVSGAWVQRYSGPSNGNCHATAVAVDRQGNVAVTGYAFDHAGAHGIPFHHCYTAKYAATNGVLLWEQRLLGTTNGDAAGGAIAVDHGGNVVVTGSSHNGTNGDYYTAKYAAADGALLWEKRYNGPANLNDAASAVALDASDNVVVTGSSRYDEDHYGCYTAKYAAADGMLLWERRFDGGPGGSGVSALAVDGGGNVVIAGSSRNSDSLDYYTARYAAADGALMWERTYNGPANLDDSIFGLAMDGGGNVLVTGRSYRSEFRSDYYTAKYAAVDGMLLWEKRYSGPPDSTSTASAVAVDASGNAVVTGYSSASGNYDIYTAKYAAGDGTLLWEKRHDGPDNHNDQGRVVAVDGSGNVVVTGSTGVDVGSCFNCYRDDIYTAKYAAADGALLWERSYNGLANGDDVGLRLALGPNGMVVVAGVSDGNVDPASTRWDYLTLVYDESLPPVSIALLPEGVRVQSTGTPGLSYRLQRAEAANGPWSTIVTLVAAADGRIEYVDTLGPDAAGFYRVSAP